MESYIILKQIGKGSYGKVWLVRHKQSSKQLVLKQVSFKDASKKEKKAALLEVQLLSTLRHPNIVNYIDSFEISNGIICLVMSYCKGGDLYTYIRKQQKGSYFPESQILEWFIQICMALQYLHSRNILHRDLKTQNIFLTHQKLIKIGDLGIARVLDETSDMATTLIGTPYYMSPEVFSNKPYNHKSDIWSLGCCVYEMASLKHAFNARDLNSLMYKVLQQKLPPLPKCYTIDLQDLIASLLNGDPDLRPSALELLQNEFIRKHMEIFLESAKNSHEQKMKIHASQPPEERNKTALKCDILRNQIHCTESERCFIIEKTNNGEACKDVSESEHLLSRKSNQISDDEQLYRLNKIAADVKSDSIHKHSTPEEKETAGEVSFPKPSTVVSGARVRRRQMRKNACLQEHQSTDFDSPQCLSNNDEQCHSNINFPKQNSNPPDAFKSCNKAARLRRRQKQSEIVNLRPNSAPSRIQNSNENKCQNVDHLPKPSLAYGPGMETS